MEHVSGHTPACWQLLRAHAGIFSQLLTANQSFLVLHTCSSYHSLCLLKPGGCFLTIVLSRVCCCLDVLQKLQPQRANRDPCLRH
jgi:hypothetical protein